MNEQRKHHPFAQPPPLSLDLVDADRAVGWIRGDVIGFRGFANETEATHAAWVAHRTVARRLARTHGGRHVPVDIEPLALRRSDTGKGDVILVSNRPIADLLRPGDGGVGDSFGFELTVPAPTTELQLRGIAYLVYRTLRKSGVRWALWRPATLVRAKQRVEADAPVSAREPVKQPRRAAWGSTRRALRRAGRWLRLTAGMPRGPSPLDSITHTVFK
jgi:hypothetical protein